MSHSKKLELHFFVCTNSRDSGKESCADKGATKLRDTLKDLCKKDPKLKSCAHRINASGCLGHCQEGIAAVLYPQGKWFTGLGENDAEKILEELKKHV